MTSAGTAEEIERFRQKKDYYAVCPRRRRGHAGHSCDRRRRKHLTEPRATSASKADGSDRKSVRLASRQDVSGRSKEADHRNAVMEAFVSPMRLEREMYQGPPINTAQFGYRVEAPQERSVKIFHKTVDDQGVATVETGALDVPGETRASLKGLGEVRRHGGSSGSLSRRRRG